MNDPGAPFRGFLPPTENWSKLPHQLIEAFPLIETLGEALSILYVLRHTWGFGDEDKKISIDEFRYGRKRRNGTRLDHGTGLSEPTLREGLSRAIRHGFICVEIDDHDKGRVEKYYRLSERATEELGGKKLTPGGERSLPPPPKKVAPRGQDSFNWGKESFSRTEKETSGKIPAKDTGEIVGVPDLKRPHGLIERLERDLSKPDLPARVRDRIEKIIAKRKAQMEDPP